MCFVVFDVGFLWCMGVLGCCVQCCGDHLYSILSCFHLGAHPLFLQFCGTQGVYFWVVGVLPFCDSAAGGVGIGGVGGWLGCWIWWCSCGLGGVGVGGVWFAKFCEGAAAPQTPPICVGLVVGVWFGQFCVGAAAPQAPLICVDLSLGLSPRLSLDLSLGLSPRLSLDLSLGLSPRLSLDLSLGLWASGWVTGCEPPIFRTGLCPFIQLSVLDQKGCKKHKNWKTAQNQTSQKTTHHMTAILMGEQQFFNIAECKRAEKPKIA